MIRQNDSQKFGICLIARNIHNVMELQFNHSAIYHNKLIANQR